MCGRESKKLWKMIHHAYTTVPFYINLREKDEVFHEDLSRVPVVGKEQYAKDGISGLSAAYMGAYVQGKLLYGRTSGSTGVFSEVYWLPTDERKSMTSLWIYRWKYYGIRPSDRLCYFFSSDIPGENVVKRENVLAISKKCLYEDTMEDRYQEILRYHPVWMILQPSMALLLCEQAEKQGTPEGLKYIEFTGEYLENNIRKRVEAVFRCRTANQYGTKEVNSIAYECPYGKLHVMEDNVFVEIVDGQICVTTLQNFAMPYVRFRLEDRGKIYPVTDCPCGRCGNVIQLQGERAVYPLLLRNGMKKHPYCLQQIIHERNYRYDGMILQYQICQEDYEKFVVFLVLEKDADEESIKREVVDGFQKRLGKHVDIGIERKEKILPDEQSGKLVPFCSHLIKKY